MTDFPNLSLGDVLVINKSYYKVVYIKSTPHTYNFQVSLLFNPFPLTINLVGKDYKELERMGEAYFFSKYEEAEILRLLYE